MYTGPGEADLSYKLYDGRNHLSNMRMHRVLHSLSAVLIPRL